MLLSGEKAFSSLAISQSKEAAFSRLGAQRVSLVQMVDQHPSRSLCAEFQALSHLLDLMDDAGLQKAGRRTRATLKPPPSYYQSLSSLCGLYI